MGFRRFKGQKSENAIRCSRRFMFLSILWEELALEESYRYFSWLSNDVKYALRDQV